jgi:predicted nucleotidyltransferase
MKTREGDLIETKENSIFDVKGLIHPPDKTIAFIRYFLNEKGERNRKGLTYQKAYSLSKRYALLRMKFPHYLVYDPVIDETLCEIPADHIEKHYDPIGKLQKMRGSRDLEPLEGKALTLTQFLKKETNIPWSAIGISGSILVTLHVLSSDIDPVVYGSENCGRVYRALRDIMRDERKPLKRYDRKSLEDLFDFRSKDNAGNFKNFVRTESRKVMQGKFLRTDYFLRFVKDWGEVHEKYGDTCYKNRGYARIKATISDDSESIFTPCTYKIERVGIIEGRGNQAITEIASFRGRFCEQARTGESVIAQGKLEQVTDTRTKDQHFRILLGNRPTDFMVLA